jgi:hypothetical protein
MSYCIQPVDDDRCVFLSHEGEMPAAELSAARYETDAMIEQRHWHRLVVDITRLQSLPGTSQLIDFASGLSSTVSRTRRVAVVVRPDQESRARLFEKIARRGRVFLTYFLDRDKAAGWVRQTTPNRQTKGRNRRETI